MSSAQADKLHELAAALVEKRGGTPRIMQLPGEDRWEVCAIEPHPEGPTCLASWVVHSDGSSALLQPGTRVRHRRHPELTGHVSRIERQRDGNPSSIPYRMSWDDDGRACDLLGWFYIYATDHGIEAIDAAS